MEYLYEKLTAYGNSDYYAFHMPGHKRKLTPIRIGWMYCRANRKKAADRKSVV